MNWKQPATWARVLSVVLCLVGCADELPPQAPVAPAAPLPRIVEQPAADPVHIAEQGLRSPLLEGLRQQLSDRENDETRGVTQQLSKQLQDADIIMNEARQKNRSAIRQANRQVRIGAARQSPNFVLLTFDRLGCGDLSCFGQTRWETPRLDTLASEGMRFTRYYAGSSETLASQGVLLTGRFSGGAVSNSKTSLPQVLWNAGYSTAAFGDLAASAKDYESHSGWSSAVPEFPEWAELNGRRITLEDNVGGQKKVSKSAFLMSEVRAFLRDTRGRQNQFFLHVSIHLFDETAIRDLTADKYQAQIQLADSMAGQITDAVQEFGLANRTVLCVTALAGPHSALNALVRENQSSGTWTHSDRGLFEGNIRVPLIVRWPDQIPPMSVSDTATGHWDLLPTMAQLAWVSRPFGKIDGLSMADVWRKNEPLPNRKFLWKSSKDDSPLAIRDQNWKATRGDSGKFQLFDLGSDPAEQSDLASKNAEIIEQLTR